MSDGVQETFHLTREPFGKDVPDELIWMDQGRQHALDLLVDTVTHRRHALVLGEPGAGKTTVLRALKSKLSPAHFRLHYTAHVTLGRRDFYRQLCFAIGIEPKSTPAAMFEGIQRMCTQNTQDHRVHSVFVLDEAQLMPDVTLGHLHVLTNFAWDSQPLLSFVFVGLVELHDRLRMSMHRSLLTRIHTKVEITPGDPSMTKSYIQKRLADAGARDELFTADALGVIHEETGGLLRTVDVLAGAALRLAARDDKPRVDREIVRRALHHTPLI